MKAIEDYTDEELEALLEKRRQRSAEEAMGKLKALTQEYKKDGVEAFLDWLGYKVAKSEASTSKTSSTGQVIQHPENPSKTYTRGRYPDWLSRDKTSGKYYYLKDGERKQELHSKAR